MKPIFEEEKQFLEEGLGIKLPDYCWKSGSFIYLNSSDKDYAIRMKVEGNKMLLVKNKIINFNVEEADVEYIKNKPSTHQIKTWRDEYLEMSEEIKGLEVESVDKTIEFLKSNLDHKIRLSDSGGKDSLLAKHISLKAFECLGIDNYVVDFYNTTNETAETYKMVKQNNPKDKLRIQNPDMGWYKWLRDKKNYYIPTVMSRTCCDKYKHGRVSDILDKDKSYIMLLGMRKYESSKRAAYDWDLNKAMGDKCNVPDNWKRFLPIVNWTDAQVWLYILHNDLEFNPMYKLGFNRIGCLICPYASDYTILLIKKHYPKQWARWEEMLLKNYEQYNVARRLKWSETEWLNGKWKAGTSKEQDLITKKATPERIKQLAEIKGMSEEIAEKYFQRVCSCGKKLNPNEVAMNLKMYGRNIDVSSMQCKKCFCEGNNISGKEYTQKSIEFMDQECNLF